jgi:hypothetical protein
MTGARAIFFLNGEKVAFSSNVTFNENIQYENINVLDNIAVREHAEVGYTVDLTCTNFRVPGQSIKQLGFMSRFNAILTQGELVAAIIDRNSAETLLTMTGVKLQGRSTTVDARGVMTETWSFVGKRSKDESGD